MCFDHKMIHLKLFILFFLFIFQSEAQDTSTTLNGPQRIHPSVAVITGVLVVFFLLLVTLSVFIYSKYFYRHIPDLSSPHNNFHQLLRSNSSSSGIDRTVVESIPFFKFSSLKGSKEGLECSVCLSKFEDSEVLKLLPMCKHAFHMNCIDKWLESHSSCPICRYKFDSIEFTSYNYTNSLRYNENTSLSNLMDDPNLEIVVEREEDRHGSTRFNFGNNFRKQRKLGNGDGLAVEGYIENNFHKLKHKIIVSDMFHKRRWSDLNSSDLMSLNSEMLNVMCSKRFNSNSPKHNLSMNEQLLKTNEDKERNRIFESRMGSINHTKSVSDSNVFSPQGNKNISSRLVTSTEKRSRSEITLLTRFEDIRVRSNRTTETSSLENNSKDERIWRIWLPIARRTFRWFAVRENNFEVSEIGTHISNV